MSEHLMEGIFLDGSIVEGTANREKREVVLDLIREGFGNPRDGHYYSKELLENSAPLFEGAKMYSDHLSPEAQKKLAGMPRSVRDVMGRITETWVDTDEGSGKTVVRGRALIAQPWLYELVEHDPELIGVSINARGTSKTGMVENKQAKMVESISRVASVDWVTEAGAGGKVVALAEAQVAEEEAAAAAKAEAEADEQVEGHDDKDGQDDRGAQDDTDRGQNDDDKRDTGKSRTLEADGDLDDVDEFADEFDEAELDDEDLDEADEDEDFEDMATADLRVYAFEAGVEDAEDLDRSGLIDALSELVAESDAPTPGAGASNGGLSPAAWASRYGRGRDHGGRQAGDINDMETGLTDVPDDMRDFIGNLSIPTASELAAAIEAEVERRTEERLGEAVEAAEQRIKAEADERVAEAEASVDRRVEQVRQRYAAREMIEATDLPRRSKDALKADFHDFFAEAKTDGEGKTIQEANVVLREAIAIAIADKRSEFEEVREARFTENGSTHESSSAGNAGSTPPAGKAPKTAPADAKVDEAIGIA